MPVDAQRTFVLAHGVDMEIARRALAAVCSMAPHAKLHSGEHGWRVLDLRDPIEGPLADSVSRHVRRMQDFADMPAGSVAASPEPFGVVLVVLGALGGGVAGAAGADLWAGIKRAARRLRRAPGRKRSEPVDGELARLLDDLATLYEAGGWPLGAPVLVRLTEARITLVVEPGLPEDAKRHAEELGSRRSDPGAELHVPLRWDRDEHRWRRLNDDWATWSAIWSLGWDVDPARQRH